LVEAERLLRSAVKLNDKHFPAQYDLGRLLVRMKRYEEAVPMLQRVTTLSASDPGAHYQLFLAYSRLKRKADADQSLARFKVLEQERKGRSNGAEDSGAMQATTDELPPPAIELPAPDVRVPLATQPR
jgi:Flp pilus assembly protein TadD